MGVEIVLVRGAPGSGKSTYAERVYPFREVYEADQFFVKDGEYKFDPSKIKDAHADCQRRVREAMKRGEDIVVANTFTKLWELKSYLDMAREFSYKVKVVHITTMYGNVHGVPPEVVQRMLDTYEPYPEEVNL